MDLFVFLGVTCFCWGSIVPFYRKQQLDTSIRGLVALLSHSKMRLLGGRFRRTDGKKDDGSNNSKGAKNLMNDQSVLPIIRFEDSNGLSPANSPERWESIDRYDDYDDWKPGSQRLTPKTRNENIMSRYPGNKSITDDNIRDDTQLGLQYSACKLSRGTILSQAGEGVFDPFCVDDSDVYQSMSQNENVFETCRDENFIPSPHWQRFTGGKLPLCRHEYEFDFEKENDVLDTKEGEFKGVLSGSTSEIGDRRDDSSYTSQVDHELPQTHRDESGEYGNDASRTKAYLNSLSVDLCRLSEIGAPTECEVSPAHARLDHRLREQPMKLGQSPRDISAEDAELASNNSFHDRVNPVEFLKSERDAETSDTYSDRVFVNFERDVCNPIQLRGNGRIIIDLEKVSCDLMRMRANGLSIIEMEYDGESDFETKLRRVEIEAGISSDDAGVEVIEVQAVESKDYRDQYPNSHTAPHKCKIPNHEGRIAYEDEIVESEDDQDQYPESHTALHKYDNHNHEGHSDDEDETVDSKDDDDQYHESLMSPNMQENRYHEKRNDDEPTVDCKTGMEHRNPPHTQLSTDSKVLCENGATTLNSAHGFFDPQQNTSRHAENQLSDLQHSVRIAAPVIGSGTISLAQYDPIRKPAEKFGILLDGGSADVDEPFEEQVEIRRNVAVKKKESRIALAQEKILSKHSVHFKTTNHLERIGKISSLASRSLLDSASEISYPHMSTQSTKSLIRPKKLPPVIDLTMVNSGSSLSALTLHAQISEDSDDVSKRQSYDDFGIAQKTTLPKLAGRNEADSTKNVDKPEPPRVGKRVDQEGKRKPPSGRESHRKSFSGHRRYLESWSNHQSLRNSFSDHALLKPLGASIEEIKMINKFLSVAGPDFDGSRLSPQELEQLLREAVKAGVTEDFANHLLDQSAGILSCHQRGSFRISTESTDPSTRGDASTRQGTPSQSTHIGNSSHTKDTGIFTGDDETKGTTGTSYSDYTYEEDPFARKTPKTEANFNCLTNIFWMESSNIVGDDMLENVKAVMSADSDSSLCSKNRRHARASKAEREQRVLQK